MTWPRRFSKSFSLPTLVRHTTLIIPSYLTFWTDSDPENFDPSALPKNVLDAIEADSFWCLSRLLDGIQDNYIFAQPGIVRSVKRMAELVSRIDGALD